MGMGIAQLRIWERGNVFGLEELVESFDGGADVRLRTFVAGGGICGCVARFRPMS